MYTAITLRSLQGANYIGRNMDFSYALQPYFYFIPRNYRWTNAVTGKEMRDSYSFMGIGQELG